MSGGARGIQSIEVSGRILRALVEHAEPMMLKDLAHAADLAPAQCHAYLASLRHVGLVQQKNDSGLYHLGPLAMRLGISWLHSNPLAMAAVRATKELTNALGVMSIVAIWGQLGPTIVHLHEGLQPMALNLRQGTLYSLSGTATGKVFAAFGEPDLIRARLDAEYGDRGRGLAQRSGLSRPALDDELRALRGRGYATAAGVPIPDVNAVSAPVFDETGKLMMVMSLVGPETVLDVSDTSTAVQRLLDATRLVADQAPRAEALTQ